MAARTPFEGERSALLDRYLLVSQLAPQLQHVIDLVRPVNGVTVTSVLVSGNLPDLRSLAMLLIEELDIEVERWTRRSCSSLAQPTPSATAVASLQLAAAVASSGGLAVPVRPQGDLAADLEAAPRRASGETCLAMALASEPRSARRARVLVGVVVHAGRQLLTGAAHFSSRHRTGPGCRVKPAEPAPEPASAIELAEPARDVEATTGRAKDVGHRAAIGRRPVAVRESPAASVG